MAPNRKASDLFTSSAELQSLKIPLQSKYLPLTDSREAAQDLQQQQGRLQQQRAPLQLTLKADPKTEKPAPTVSYWDWPSDTAEEEKQEAIDDLFSLSRFESNLIADSIRRKENIDTGTKLRVSEEQQSYWDLSDDVAGFEVDTQENEASPQTPDESHCEECCQDYWEWQEDEEAVDACTRPSPSDRLHGVVANSRKKFYRRHSHLPEPDHTADVAAASDHYWHW
eukprot:CAMPEP_0201116634 /NCGR_PEP_ID=MMETSP0850-20130426/837_1 /ASSEMBLY_ACC=CAM_ASM_000622 /TAXON_ID=183588 /ORGANISM="Pseudo-nitzschia fraudulenta, Strain WWA7" /LENGTH=224 /DNA_ID=CAMNT_0047380751 /DNA_START=96 /DNA_END=767 /DNA_ORIENTATION=+